MNKEIYELACKAAKETRIEHPELPKNLPLSSMFSQPFKAFIVTEYEVEKLVELAVKSKEIRNQFGVD